MSFDMVLRFQIWSYFRIKEQARFPVCLRFFVVDLQRHAPHTKHYLEMNKDGKNVLRNVRHLRAGTDIAWHYATMLPAAAGSVLVVAVNTRGSQV